MTVATEAWVFSVGLVQLGYVANVFYYLKSTQAKGALAECELVLPLGRGVTFAETSIHGATLWSRGSERIELHGGPGWRVRVDAKLEGKPLRGEITLHGDEALSLVYPLPDNRAAYTHKEAGLRAEGELRWGNDRLDFSGASGAVDWTRSLPNRHTHWKWASASGLLPNGTRLGLNLSAEVYDDAQGNSRENALWADHRVQVLPGARFTMPANPLSEPWGIRSPDSDHIDLEFRPTGARVQSLDYGLIRSRFTQAFGTYHGRIGEYELPGIPGLAEDHDALW